MITYDLGGTSGPFIDGDGGVGEDSEVGQVVEIKTLTVIRLKETNPFSRIKQGDWLLVS